MFKKFLLILIIFFVTASTAFSDRIPTSSRHIKNYGVGVYKLENDFYVFEKPDANAKKIRHFYLPSKQNKSAIIRTTENEPYIVSIPSQENYFVTVSEYPEEDWLQIYYDENEKNTGWIKLQDEKNFFTWKDFFYRYGKQNGLAIMRDVPETDFRLYSQDNEDSQIIEKFTYPEYIEMRMIRGNWMLVTVVDKGTIYKTGWFKWRTDEGKLRLFPKFKP